MKTNQRTHNQEKTIEARIRKKTAKRRGISGLLKTLMAFSLVSMTTAGCLSPDTVRQEPAQNSEGLAGKSSVEDQTISPAENHDEKNQSVMENSLWISGRLEELDQEQNALENILNHLQRKIENVRKIRNSHLEEFERARLKLARALVRYQKDELSLQELEQMSLLMEETTLLKNEDSTCSENLARLESSLERAKRALEKTALERETTWNQALILQEEADLTDYRSGGEPNQEKTILPDQIPEFAGGIRSAKNFEEEDIPERENGNQTACLAFAADSFSSFQSRSAGLLLPADGQISAGTWHYPAGGLHLGLDLALSMYTPIKAPADGLVLYADAPVADGGGYLGNWSGWPLGGGNTLALLVEAGGKYYAVTFAHLSRSIMVSPGQQIRQNDIIALSGNSGNSTGPHTHIEVFEITCSPAELVAFFSRTSDFSFGTGWDTPAGVSLLARRLRPEEVFQ